MKELPGSEKNLETIHYIDTILACDRQTDGRTEERMSQSSCKLKFYVGYVLAYGLLLHAEYSSSSRTSPELERSGFHEVLPVFSILSVFPS